MPDDVKPGSYSASGGVRRFFVSEETYALNRAACKWCGAAVVWTTDVFGRRLPCDDSDTIEEPERGGWAMARHLCPAR